MHSKWAKRSSDMNDKQLSSGAIQDSLFRENTTMKFKHSILIGLLCGIFATSVTGEEQASQNTATIRSGKFEISGKLNYLGEMKRTDDNGAVILFKDDVGAGLEVGYHFTEHLNVSFEFTYNTVGHDAVLGLSDPIVQDSIFGDSLDITNAQVNFSYFLLDTDFTPFISAGFGWAHIASDADQGQSDENCGQDSSSGYVCDGHYNIDDNFDFSYNAKVGVRWNFGKQMFIGGSYSKQWFDFSNAETADGEVIQIQLGFYY
ncbi:MAG TPA: hypothetical protein EYG51_22395 [Pseudomonadales bacterium]|nr:hypothetical protein [Pseudomonadales bacterium]